MAVPEELEALRKAVPLFSGSRNNRCQAMGNSTKGDIVIK